MFAEYHKAIVRRFFDAVFYGRDLAAVGDLIPAHPLLAAATRRTAAAYHREVPDIRFTIDTLVAEDDLVAACWTARGTMAAPSGPVVVSGVYVFRLAGGAIAGLRPHTTWPIAPPPGTPPN